MGRRYSGVGSAAVGTNLTVLALESAATIRPEIYEFVIGSGANAPGDLATIFHLERFTAAGTEGSGFTPYAIDPADLALSLADYGTGLYTLEPTYTAGAILYNLPLNERGTFRWVASPGSGFKSPATAASGTGLQSQSSGGTVVHQATMLHEE